MKKNPKTLSMNAHLRECLSCELVGDTIDVIPALTQIKRTTLTYLKTKVLVVVHARTSLVVVSLDGEGSIGLTTSSDASTYVALGTTYLIKSSFPTFEKNEEANHITEPLSKRLTFA